ncbi:MAG: hypothetical protein H0T45_13500 [Pyrinomonadaceae bacterium]|nr:hypothetical protein [Pyrinomonadaceae bacterium]
MSKRTIPVCVADGGCPFRLSLIVLAALACVASALNPLPDCARLECAGDEYLRKDWTTEE